MYLQVHSFLKDGFIFFHNDVLRDLVPFVQFKNAKNTYGGLLLLVK